MLSDFHHPIEVSLICDLHRLCIIINCEFKFTHSESSQLNSLYIIGNISLTLKKRIKLCNALNTKL